MDSRLSISLLMLVISFIPANARSLVSLDAFVVEVDNKIQSESNIVRNEKLCTLCEDFTSKALYYLGENETETQVISTLHKACSTLHSFKQQCITLVDYYAPMFFLEVSTISPEQFCEKVNLCGETVVMQLPKCDDACSLCHNVVVEVLIKLKDPDTELEVLETLLKGCSKMENFAQKCKKLVFQYGPLFLADAEKFLETNDVCTAIHACKNSQEDLAASIIADA
ncbi:Saposin-like type B, region 1 [Musa troglodytarum]|uniref:Pulmonary surfactant-associated protein B n=2 Tax=Musa troglodytarum TaxID=320322 RepID=A0A9E7F453_9LILI|nr:Saposin-like type B, region 1 [Musa troglodytarum]URD88271.1 Saposin-like type B, region 1 [Musa troglodytarum]